MAGTRRSAGLLLHRTAAGGRLEVLVAHMGGPFWARKDEGAWSIPKGEYEPDEDPLDAARREFTEELGLPVPDGPLVALGEVRQSSGKRLTAWSLRADLDPDAIVPGTFELEWPPRSGRIQAFPEVDRVAWVDLPAARRLLVRGQVPLLDRLEEALGAGPAVDGPDERGRATGDRPAG
jgi:predicted NUDIX family NTP pyrophosphohydrolase